MEYTINTSKQPGASRIKIMAHPIPRGSDGQPLPPAVVTEVPFGRFVFFSRQKDGGISEIVTANGASDFLVNLEGLEEENGICRHNKIEAVKDGEKVFLLRDSGKWNLYIREDVAQLSGPVYAKSGSLNEREITLPFGSSEWCSITAKYTSALVGVTGSNIVRCFGNEAAHMSLFFHTAFEQKFTEGITEEDVDNLARKAKMLFGKMERLRRYWTALTPKDHELEVRDVREALLECEDENATFERRRNLLLTKMDIYRNRFCRTRPVPMLFMDRRREYLVLRELWRNLPEECRPTDLTYNDILNMGVKMGVDFGDDNAEFE